MSVEKLYFEPQTDRFFLVLKASGKLDKESVSITVGNVMDEGVLSNLMMKSDSVKNIFRQLRIRVRGIRILRKINAPDSAAVTLSLGRFSRRTIRVSTMEAIRMAAETGQSVDVPREMVRAEQIDLASGVDSFERARSSVFFPKFIERDHYPNNEVIM